MELVTQAYTKIPCVNTEEPMGAQDNCCCKWETLGCCKWETLVDTENSLTENSLCTQGNLCIDTTFLSVKVLWSTKKFSVHLSVDTGFSM